MSKLSTADPRVTLHLTIDPARPVKGSWIWTRMNQRSMPGTVPNATTEIAVFRVTAKFKLNLRDWLEARSGLTKDFVYPTSWHQPHLDRFASDHGRMAGFLYGCCSLSKIRLLQKPVPNQRLHRCASRRAQQLPSLFP